jgi:hypothetical protein
VTRATKINLIALSVVAVGLALIVWKAPKAATPALDEPEEAPRTHQLAVCEPGKPRKCGKPVGPIACEMDGAAEKLLRTLPDGSRIECRKVSR